MVAVRKDCRPDGAGIHFGFGFYKYAAPDGAEHGRRQGGRAQGSDADSKQK